MGPAYQLLVRVGPNLQALVVLMIDGFSGIWSSAVGLRGAHSTGILPKMGCIAEQLAAPEERSSSSEERIESGSYKLGG